MIGPESRPRLAARARLRFDRRGARYLLLYPERGLELNSTAVAIVRLCTGEHTVAGIVERLRETYPEQPRERVEREVLVFLGRLADRGLLEFGGAVGGGAVTGPGGPPATGAAPEAAVDPRGEPTAGPGREPAPAASAGSGLGAPAAGGAEAQGGSDLRSADGVGREPRAPGRAGGGAGGGAGGAVSAGSGLRESPGAALEAPGAPARGGAGRRAAPSRAAPEGGAP